MRIIALLLFLVFSVVTYSQRTDTKGYLQRIDYTTGEFDTTKINNWSSGRGDSPQGSFSYSSFYYKVFEYNKKAYLLSAGFSDGVLPTFTLKISNADTDNSLIYLSTLNDFHIFSPYTLLYSEVLFSAKGLLILNGEVQQSLVENVDSLLTKKEFDFSQFDERMAIAGKIDSLCLLVPIYAPESGDSIFYLCDIDSNLAITPQKQISANATFENYDYLYPLNIKRISSNFFYSKTNSDIDLIYNYENDFLAIINIVEKRSNSFLYDNHIFYWDDFNVVKRDIDTTSGKLSDATTIITNVNWYEIGYPETGNNICFWQNDTMNVFNLDTQEIIFSENFDKDSYSSNQPLIDSKYIYLHRVESVTDIKEEIQVPNRFHLAQNYPNPFNPSTTIEFNIPMLEFRNQNSELVSMRVYDILGREVATLVNEPLSAGKHEVQFDGSSLASGVYFYRLEAGNFLQSKKFILLK